MIVSYLVSKLALSDAKDFISKNFVKLLIINIILRGFPIAVFIIGSILYFSSTLDVSKIMLDASKILFVLGTIFFWVLAFSIFLLIIDYIYGKSIIYFIASKENDKYRTFLKWAILDISIIKSIKSFIGYILIVGLYTVMILVITIIDFFLSFTTSLVSIFLLLGTIIDLIFSIVLFIIIEIILLFILGLSSYTTKSYFFARVNNPSNWSSLKMAFSSISGKVIKRILELVLYAVIVTITLLGILLAILFAMRFVDLNLNLIIIGLFVILIYLFTEFIAYNIISDLYILNIIKTNSQSEMGQNAEQSK
jgi:hypothetical protein